MQLVLLPKKTSLCRDVWEVIKTFLLNSERFCVPLAKIYKNIKPKFVKMFLRGKGLNIQQQTDKEYCDDHRVFLKGYDKRFEVCLFNAMYIAYKKTITLEYNEIQYDLLCEIPSKYNCGPDEMRIKEHFQEFTRYINQNLRVRRRVDSNDDALKNVNALLFFNQTIVNLHRAEYVSLMRHTPFKFCRAKIFDSIIMDTVDVSRWLKYTKTFIPLM
jgi:hypothetical protein